MSDLTEISEAAEFSETLRAHKLVLTDFYTPSCIICRKIEPMLQVVADEFSASLHVSKVNAEAVPEVAVSCNVRGVPSLVLLKDGDIIDRKVGFVSAGDLRAWLRPHLTPPHSEN